MFGLFRSNSTVKLQKAYEDLLRQAMEAQRSGDIRTYSELTVEAEAIYKKIHSSEAPS